MLIRILFLLFLPLSIHTQTATFYSAGVNSPWGVGLDYDLGFGKLFSFNTGFYGGVNSQVNAYSTFGDVYFGELSTGLRMYMNKFDTWEGSFIGANFRFGIYNVPFRVPDTSVVLNRQHLLLIGFNVIIGYRWKRKLVSDMTDLPFTLVIEPYLGWSLDGFIGGAQGINRFTIGFTFKIGFYTYKKSKETLEQEAKDKETKEAEEAETKEKEKAEAKEQNIILDPEKLEPK